MFGVVGAKAAKFDVENCLPGCYNIGNGAYNV
jgi:hypothetical protein